MGHRYRAAFGLVFMLAGCGDDDGGQAGTDSGTQTSGGTAVASTTTDPVTDSGQTGETDSGLDETGSDTGAGNACGANLLDNPSDTAAAGPWPVGARTVDIDGLRVEAWYPGEVGSDAGASPVIYDPRDHLPESERGKISDEQNPWQDCDCYPDLPVDEAHGPYPVIVFIHGTAGFRTQSLPLMTHWASRGFVVLAADHPGLRLAAMLNMLCAGPTETRDLEGDVQRLLAAVRGEAPGLEFAEGIIDAERIGMSGHSAGGFAVADWGSDAQVLAPLAGAGTTPGAALQSTLVMGGNADSVVSYEDTRGGYESSPSPKRFVGIENAGHLIFSQLCSLQNSAGQNFVEIGNEVGVCGTNLAGFLFQCGPELIADPDGWEIVHYATSAAFEETLHCSDVGANLDDIQAAYPAVAEYLSD